MRQELDPGLGIEWQPLQGQNHAGQLKQWIVDEFSPVIGTGLIQA